MSPARKPFSPATQSRVESVAAPETAPAQQHSRKSAANSAQNDSNDKQGCANRIKIVLADDHRMFREALQTMLEKVVDLEIVAEACDGQELIRMAKLHEPDIVCMDIGMPGMNGIEATRHLQTINPRIKVIALSAFTDQQFVLDMLNAGATAYVTKAEAGEELLRAIRSVQRNRTYLGQDIAERVTDALRDGPQRAPDAPRLSSRERQVLQLVAEGSTSPKIAETLHLAPTTVEVHRRNIMRKLGLHSVAELTRYAIRHGLTSA